MGYVKRDTDGNITAHFARFQQGINIESIADNDPELLAFLNPPAKPVADQVEDGIAADPKWSALVRRIAKHEGITERALLDEIRAEAKEIQK